MLRLRTLTSLLVALTCLTSLCAAQTAGPIASGTIAKVDDAIAHVLRTARVEGATIAIIKDGNIIYAGGFGKRNVAAGLAADVATAYEVGSITKQFTAAAVLQLEEAGKVRLDAPLATYLPNVPHAKEVTIRQLLTLTSGMPEYVQVANAGTPATFDQLIASVSGKPLDFAPGTQFGASNTNYLILGRVVEVVSGERWGDYVRDRLFAPAGMTESSTIAYESQLTEMARGYAISNGKAVPSQPLDDSWASAAGDIVTTVDDLSKWDAALAAGKIVTLQDHQLMTTPQLLADGSSSGYGMGAYVDTSDEQPRILAQGDTLGFDASDVAYPKQGLRIIVLTNTEDNGSSSSGSTEIADSVYDAMLPASASATTLYAAAVRTMDYVRQPAFVLYTLEGKSDGIHIDLQTARHQVWLLFQHGNAPSTWVVKHRTQDYASEVIDGERRYVSERSLFDPTWFGTFRALRDGMIGYQDVEAPRPGLTVAAPTPTPDPKLSTIASVSAIGTGIYSVQDRGPAACSNGDPGHALHLTPRRHDPRRQLTDVIVDLRSMRFCSIRYGYSDLLWLTGSIEQHYADVGGFWMETDGSMDGKLRILGIPTHRFVWQYRLSNMTFPRQITSPTFVPDPAQ